ncbi:glutamine amidotransferase [Rarobacter incanus]|nr:glutamine amidotransferase [Rarobacter incanus]
MKPFLLVATRFDDAIADAEFESFWRLSGLREDQLARVRAEQGPMEPIDLRDYSGIIIGGGPFNASDPYETKTAVQRRVEREIGELVERVVAADFPLFGACYGVGTVATRLGAQVDRTFGEPVGAVTIEVSDEGRVDPLLAGLPRTFDAFVGHKEACRTLPPGATWLASSMTCPVQMFRYQNNQYVTQFHPELDSQGFAQRIAAYRDEGYFDPAEIDEVIARVKSATVDVPRHILARFAQRYATD